MGRNYFQAVADAYGLDVAMEAYDRLRQDDIFPFNSVGWASIPHKSMDHFCAYYLFHCRKHIGIPQEIRHLVEISNFNKKKKEELIKELEQEREGYWSAPCKDKPAKK